MNRGDKWNFGNTQNFVIKMIKLENVLLTSFTIEIQNQNTLPPNTILDAPNFWVMAKFGSIIARHIIKQLQSGVCDLLFYNVLSFLNFVMGKRNKQFVTQKLNIFENLYLEN